MSIYLQIIRVRRQSINRILTIKEYWLTDNIFGHNLMNQIFSKYDFHRTLEGHKYIDSTPF